MPQVLDDGTRAGVRARPRQRPRSAPVRRPASAGNARTGGQIEGGRITRNEDGSMHHQLRPVDVVPARSWPMPGSMQSQSVAPSSGGGFGGGGSGGGGGVNPNVQGQIDFLTQLLNGGSLNAQQRTYTPDTALAGQLTTAVQGDRAAAGESYNALDAYLARQQSPYAGAQAEQVPQVQDSLSNLLRTQGMDTGAYQANNAAVNVQGGQQQAAAQQMLDMLGMNWRQSQDSRTLQSGQDRAYADREIAAGGTALQAALARQEAERKRQIDDQNFQLTQASQQAKLQLAMQIAELAASMGGQMPDLASLGL